MASYDCPKKGVGGPCTIRKLSEVYIENAAYDSAGNLILTEKGKKLTPPSSPELNRWWYFAPVLFPYALLFIPISKRAKFIFIGFFVAACVGYGVMILLSSASQEAASQHQTGLGVTIALFGAFISIIGLGWYVLYVWSFYRALKELQQTLRIQYEILMERWSEQYYCTTHGSIIDPA